MEGQAPGHAAAALTVLAQQGFVYYQINSEPGACEACEEHNGAIYPVANAAAGETLPPFHPNCKCGIEGIAADNPFDHPGKGDMLLWLDIMYGGDSLEQNARKVREYYRMEDVSVEEIAAVLASLEGVTHIGQRMQAFFYMLNNSDKTIIEDWFTLYHAPTVYGTGRIVEMPEIEGFHRANWYAFEGLRNINPNARFMIGEENTHVVIGDKGEVLDHTGRYWVAVGPNVMNPGHLPTESITLEEMKYGTKLDVVLTDDDGNLSYLPVIVGDTKAHTYPNGILQTGYAFPNGIDPHPHPRADAPIEFIGAVLPAGLKYYEIVHIIVYDQ